MVAKKVEDLLLVIIVIMLLCGATVVADCKKGEVTTDNLIDMMGVTWGGIIDSVLWSPAKIDTTRYYIKEIKQKCDTTLVRITDNICDSGILRCGCGHYATHTTKIKCVDDTVWAEKVQVWLTPEQLKRLIKQITPRKPGEPMELMGTW